LPEALSGGGDDDQPAVYRTTIRSNASPLIFQTVNVGGDSAISRIMVTGQDTEGCIITACKVTSPLVLVMPPENRVYQYVAITSAGCPFSTGMHLEFEVPLSYVKNCQSAVDDVRLYQLQNQSWVCLPTITRGSKNGFALYQADSQEFSLYAIILLNQTIVPAREDTLAVNSTTPVIAEESGNPAFPDITETTPEPHAPFMSDNGCSWMTFAAGMTMITGIVIGVVLIRKWWIR